MQILVPKCRIQSTSPLISSFFVAYFRSTPTPSDKWKNKWFNSPDFGDVKPSKTYIKYKTRQKRADAKKALKDTYFGSGTSKFTLEGEFSKTRRTRFWDDDPTENRNKRGAKSWDDDPTENRNKNRWDPFRSDSKAHQRRKKNKWKRGNTFEEFEKDEDDDDDHRTRFEGKFGKKRYSWSFKFWEESFSQSQTSSKTRNKWRTVSDDDESTEDDGDSYVVGSHSDRITLGLPTNGPLKIEEVKNAFRLSALKWHPDKHQGPSQALAEEKFKLCASAYKSLCSALSSRV